MVNHHVFYITESLQLVGKLTSLEKLQLKAHLIPKIKPNFQTFYQKSNLKKEEEDDLDS